MALSNNVEDRELIEDFLKGNQEGFDKIVSKYQNMVFNMSFRMLGDREEALDVAQDIFLKLYGSLKTFRHESKFSTYLYSMCVNFCRNRLKVLQNRRKRQAFSLDDPVDTAEGSVSREIANGKPDPRENVDAQERGRLITDAIDELNAEYKEAILLREMEGLSYEEMADVLEVDLGTIKSRLNRARSILKEKLRGVL